MSGLPYLRDIERSVEKKIRINAEKLSKVGLPYVSATSYFNVEDKSKRKSLISTAKELQQAKMQDM